MASLPSLSLQNSFSPSITISSALNFVNFENTKMRILEISSPSPELRQQDTLTQLESLVKLTETLSPKSPTPSTLSSQLRNCVSQLSQLGPDSLANSVKLQLWKLSYRLWNACVDLSNSSSSSRSGNDHVEFRRAAADLLFIAGDVSGVPSPSLKAASFYYKTGLIYHELKNFEFASNCFEKATDLVSKVEIESISDLAEKRMFLDINIARARTSWEVSDRNLSITLLNRSKKFLFEMAGNYGVLAEQYLAFGKALLAKSEVLEAKEALKLMNEGLELCERGLRVVKKTEETLHLKCLRDKTLRFIAALHLQREEYESVIKCLRVLRDHSGIKSGDAHPSLSVLAMKAWLGLGRSSEAEKELRDMVVNKGIPEGVWVSAVEAYFKAVGVAAIETVKSVFMGLLGRCQVSASAAVRVIYRVIGEGGGGGGGEGLRIREIMVEELVTDERVVTLFAGDGAARERTALHAVLWNCAAAHFRSKEYKISANLFEKAMLYEPSGIESRILRAKGYRVLCLCHLALSQLDQAKEYIDEAEKLEPNIACAFLKFKIYLQTNDHTAAITQMKAMMRCTDFTTAYLSLSAHEAVACRALSVAVASLSDLLNFYTSGKQMPIAEIVVFRTILAILTQEPGNELEVLKFMKRAESRISELGPDNFFGKGEVGIRERNWIATIAWNIGTKAGAEKNYELCAEFMHTSADFYSAIMDGEIEGNSAMVCKSIILSVSAMLSSEKQNKVAMLDAQLKKVLELLERAEKLMEALSTSDKLLDCEDNTLDPKLYIAYILSAYELHGRRNDTVSQQQLVKKFANSKACNPKHLLQIGLTASQGPHQNAEVATFTLNTCLSAMLASPLQDYKDVALVIRRLITLAVIYKGDADDEVVYSLYKQAYKIMVGLKEGEYPVTEGKWLATTSWNRAALPVRLGQVDGAKKWMNMGLELAKKVSGLETYKACMEDYITGFEKRLPEND